MIVFGKSSSHDNGKKIDTSLFVQKPYLKKIYKESSFQEDIDLKSNLELKIHHIPLTYENQLQEKMLILNLTILVK